MNEVLQRIEPEPERDYAWWQRLEDVQKWSWAAGFMDGEGCFCISREKDSRKGSGYRACRPSIAVSNTNHFSLLRITEIFGIPSKTIIRPQVRRHHKQQWQINIRNQAEIVRITQQLLPYLIVKRCVAELLMRFCQSRLNQRGKGRYAKHTESELFLVKCIGEQNERRKPHPWDHEH